LEKRGKSCMIEKIFFDTDCLSAFLWVKNENLLVKLYGGKIVLPEQVYRELSHPRTPQLKQRTDVLKQNGSVSVETIEVGTPEYKLYYKLLNNPETGFRVIGKGEAAAIALTKIRGGIIASNNLRDIQKYVEEYKLEHITTGDILCEALEQGIMTEEEGNIIWANMLDKRRMLPSSTFTKFILTYKKG
jgi:predicted nucleic acid-binding protein